ncbi:hypothetical protein [Micromonospora sp. KC723]|uniref:hypothetical protein n=1 Tax=Micromonospora sp. KC723 TaxID=2530381 RepID=UPI00104E3C89|nr:hypothetical protein [Micromonospora sp. KC723]TDB70306.1 hypothetical protein E1165_26130 [Micromonospora sp. KC723]
MSAEHEMIDLGDHDPQSVSSGGTAPDRVMAKGKVNGRLVATFVVGLVLGGVAVSELRDAREERQRSTSISLVAFVASGGSGGGDSGGVYQMA